MSEAFIDTIVRRAEAARGELLAAGPLADLVDPDLPIPRPFGGSGPIRLVVIGQDPTVAKAASRARIATVLNMDRPGEALYRYIAQICDALGLAPERHVYATNLCKCFFRTPPTTITTVDVLAASLPVWLPILRDELAQFPDAAVVTLGEPVLENLVSDPSRRWLRHYWGYRPGWQTAGAGPTLAIEPEAGPLGRRIFPLPHQPSLRAAFYKAHLDRYLAFIRQTIPAPPGERVP
ncbi:MAG TPA: uracil-DNA glycosylase family protein [Roseiflexaceae bacterium]|nr:uracil-DNA glycosylase family protein [Roseiflexaceae bacterium]